MEQWSKLAEDARSKDNQKKDSVKEGEGKDTFKQKRIELARTTVETIEKERQRIAEHLHNGLAQTLYGIKISLWELSSKSEDTGSKALVTHISGLLEEAISENRRIS